MIVLIRIYFEANSVYLGNCKTISRYNRTLSEASVHIDGRSYSSKDCSRSVTIFNKRTVSEALVIIDRLCHKPSNSCHKVGEREVIRAVKPICGRIMSHLRNHRSVFRWAAAQALWLIADADALLTL